VRPDALVQRILNAINIILAIEVPRDENTAIRPLPVIEETSKLHPKALTPSPQSKRIIQMKTPSLLEEKEIRTSPNIVATDRRSVNSSKNQEQATSRLPPTPTSIVREEIDMTDTSSKDEFKKGQVVTVKARTWPGINKLGGTAWITDKNKGVSLALSFHHIMTEIDINSNIIKYLCRWHIQRQVCTWGDGKAHRDNVYRMCGRR
jgi:hypothetical protein